MLRIFKDYPLETSILDDFTFYESKQDNQLDMQISSYGDVQNLMMNEPINMNNVNMNAKNILNNNSFMQKHNPEKVFKRINSTENILKSKNQNDEEEN